jgi:hypothetical protein
MIPWTRPNIFENAVFDISTALRSLLVVDSPTDAEHRFTSLFTRLSTLAPFEVEGRPAQISDAPSV